MKRFNKVSLVVLVVSFMFVAFGFTGPSIVVAATPINLGTADNFAVLAGTPFIANTGSSIITGDVGLSPATGAGMTGFPPATVVGTIYAVDSAGPAGSVNNPTLLTAAKNDLTAAYLAAASSTPTATITSDLGSFQGGVLTPGVYHSDSTVGLTGTVTLDGQGDPNAVFIIQAGSSLTTAASSSVVLINGAQACNVFWQVGSSAGTLGANSIFKGDILSLTSITLITGARVEGRVLARNGAVTLDSNIITKAICVASPASASTAVTSGGSGNPPLISVTKIPTPLVLPVGGGSVTYDYTVLNVGTAAMSNVTVTDNKCAPVVFVSGDTNGNGLLDERQTETWKYRCTTTLSQTTTNTVTATGHANGYTAIDVANATVVVGVPIIPPLIHLVKTPNIFLLPAPGGAVTYTYIVTNPGTAPLSDVSITDNKCTGLPGRVVGHPGDINKNNLLDPGEAWQFTCQTNITQTTINTGTAEGSANGLTAIDFSPATVVVSPAVVAPKLPNTGLPPEEKSTPWNIVIPAGIFAALIFFYFVRRKQTA